MIKHHCIKNILNKSFFVFAVLCISFYSNTNAAFYSWTYKQQPLSFNYTFDFGAYNYYKSQSKWVHNMAVFAEEHTTHPYLSAFADTLRKKAMQHQWVGNSERDMVIQFVQETIPYKKDPYNKGYDYPRYPIETLYEQRGDCEDKSCLLAALLKTMGYDAVLLAFPDHMAVGVVADDCKGTSYKYDGKNYLYVETTSVYTLGKNPGYGKARVQKINQTAYASIYAQGQNLRAASPPDATINNANSKQPLAKVLAKNKLHQHKYYTNTSGRPVVKCTAAYLEAQRTAIKKRNMQKANANNYKRNLRNPKTDEVPLVAKF